MKVKNWLTSNAKMKKDGILAFGIPAYKSADNKYTCPAAKDCLTGCYARQGFYVMANVRKAQEERLALTKSVIFVSTMVEEIRRRKPKIVRIHDSGDFYSSEYLNLWREIAFYSPKTRFYAYTKMVPLFKGKHARPLSANLKIVFSYGGKYDFMIDREVDNHSVIFDNVKELRAAKYVNCSVRDYTYKPKVQRVGLIYHGFASKAFNAGKEANQ